MTAQSAAIPAVKDTAAFTGPCTYRGFSISSTAGADVTIYDGTSAAGTILAQFTLAAKGWASDNIPDGVRCTTGIYVAATNPVQGHVRVG